MSLDVIKCPYCKSTRIFYLRIDSDWGSGIGSYYPENDESEYTQDDLKLDSFDRPDIDLYHCRECDRMFEEECL